MNRQKKKLLLSNISFLVVCAIIAGLFFYSGNKNKKATIPPSDINKVEDLAGTKIGVQLGTTGDIYVSDYEGDEAGTIIEKYNKGADAILALKQGKIDCIVIDEVAAKSFIAKNDDLSILEEEFTVEDYAICVGKGNDQLLAKINDSLEELSKNGTMDQIYNYYLNNEDGTYEPYVVKDIPRNNGTLTVATNVAFPPYEYYESNMPKGIDMDLARAIADYLGMKLKIEDMEFDSIIVAVSSGKADIGMAGMSVTPDRLKNIDFSESYATSKQVIIVRNGSSLSKQSFTEKFKQNFINDGRWKYLVKGLKNTLVITLFAAIIGIILGFIIAIIRVGNNMNGSFGLWNWFCKLYLTVMRGTPAVIQLLIIYYVIFASVNVSKILVAVIAFGLNSAAYVAEAVRAGIMSIDKGQFEAGRSLGLSFNKTMIYIILPQAIKNTLPALGNEFIALIKETSISGYIGLQDLTKGGDIIRSTTWEAFMPYIAVALLYLIIVMILTWGVNCMERRLKKNER